MGDRVLHAIGVKVLRPEMMKCNFKHTNSVLHSIENFRFVAQKQQNDFNYKLRHDSNDALMAARGFNNAISILGSRGSGKTSIIMTLQYILRYGKEAWEKNQTGDLQELRENIIMPILVPQDFVQGQDLLGWIIVQLLGKAEDVEREYNQHGAVLQGKYGPFAEWIDDKCDKQFSNPLRECIDALKSSYELRYKIIKQSCDQSSHVYQYMDEIKRDANLVKDMLKLISMLIDYYRFITKKEPLLFFVIDDLDLAPNRSQEILNLVLRYLQHPNAVVLCGWNQELFQTHLTMEVLRNQGITDKSVINVNGDYVDVFMTRQRKRVSLLDSARRLSMDNLKKAFPPALRYEVRGFDTEQKANFPNVDFTHYTNQEDYGSLIDLIEKALLASHSTTQDSSSGVSFMRTPQDELIRVYMRIFDNKCRGLINVYHAFEMLKIFFEDQKRDEPVDVTHVLQSLLDTILFSNTRFVPYRRGLRDLIRIDRVVLAADGNNENTVCEYYCNFQKILPVLKEYRDKFQFAEEQDIYHVESVYNYFPSLIIDVFLLLNFMENVLRYICNLPVFEHGGAAFSSILNDIIPPVQIDMDPQNDRNLLTCAITSANIQEIALFPNTSSFRVNLRLLDAYEKNGFCDELYDFAGSHSYCRLSKAISSLLRKEEKVDDGADENTLPVIDKDILEKMIDKTPWMKTMYDLFMNLVFDEKNVARLSRFRCFVRQGIYKEEDDELIRNASITQKKSISDTKNMLKSYGKKRIINNADLDCLVNSLRELERLKTRMFLPSDVEGVMVDRLKSIRVDDPILSAKYGRTVDFVNAFGSVLYTDKAKKQWIDPSVYYDIITTISKSRAKKMNSSDCFDEELLDICNDYVRDVETVLLENLKIRLYYSVHQQYSLRQTNIDKYEYLLKASSAISKYLDRWKIGHLFWSMVEQEAVEGLELAFQGKEYMDAYRYTRSIAQYGPRIQETSRDKYIRALENLKKWMSSNRRLFKLTERDSIEEKIQILQRAARSITRPLNTDKNIEDVLTELGKAIAEESARIAFSDELTADKSSTERDRVTWPIIQLYRSSFDNWKNVSLNVNNEIESSTNTTFFN